MEVDTSKLASGSTTPQFLCIIFATLGVNWKPGAATHGSERAKTVHTSGCAEGICTHVFIRPAGSDGLARGTFFSLHPSLLCLHNSQTSSAEEVHRGTFT